VNRFHREGMAEDKGNPFSRAEVGQPLPREDAFHPYP